MCAFKASVRDQDDLMSLSDGLFVVGLEEEPMGMPSVYHDPDTDTVEETFDVNPSAAKLPGMGMFGIDVLTVRFDESYTRS